MVRTGSVTPWHLSLQAGPLWPGADRMQLSQQGPSSLGCSHSQQGVLGEAVLAGSSACNSGQSWQAENSKHMEGLPSKLCWHSAAYPYRTQIKQCCRREAGMQELVLLVYPAHSCSAFVSCICLFSPSVRLGCQHCHALFFCCHGYTHGKSVCTCD